VPTNKQRREAARRHLERQLERRVQREQSRKRFALISSVVGTLVVIGVVVGLIVGLGGNGSGTKQPAAAGPTPTPSDTNVLTTPDGAKYGDCTFTKSGKAARPVTMPKDGKVPTTGTVRVRVATNRGDLTFALNRKAAPCTVYSFVSLVKQGFYDKTPCHRLVTSGIFVLQCGDPTGTGTGGPGYTIPDEALGNESYPAGTIAMARTSAANSGGSQFFIVYKDSPALKQNLGTQQYTVFGKVTSGLSVVDKVAAAGSDNSNGPGDGKPKLSTEITSMTAAKAS
jgi:peptidyl-prolyl cis-trans isomerase B (cyclophilin B)